LPTAPDGLFQLVDQSGRSLLLRHSPFLNQAEAAASCPTDREMAAATFYPAELGTSNASTKNRM
jgi:hypothetical protein